MSYPPEKVPRSPFILIVGCLKDVIYVLCHLLYDCYHKGGKNPGNLHYIVKGG